MKLTRRDQVNYWKLQAGDDLRIGYRNTEEIAPFCASIKAEKWLGQTPVRRSPQTGDFYRTTATPSAFEIEEAIADESFNILLQCKHIKALQLSGGDKAWEDEIQDKLQECGMGWPTRIEFRHGSIRGVYLLFRITEGGNLSPATKEIRFGNNATRVLRVRFLSDADVVLLVGKRMEGGVATPFLGLDLDPVSTVKLSTLVTAWETLRAQGRGDRLIEPEEQAGLFVHSSRPDPFLAFIKASKKYMSARADGDSYVICPTHWHKDRTGFRPALFEIGLAGQLRPRITCYHKACNGRSLESFAAGYGYKGVLYGEPYEVWSKRIVKLSPTRFADVAPVQIASAPSVVSHWASDGRLL